MIKLDLKPSDRQLVQFGWIALVGFAIPAVILWKWFGWGPIVWILFALGAAMGLCALARFTAPIKPVYVVMMLVSFPIGVVLSTVLLALIYYLLFTPVALFFKLTGRDPLHRRLDPAAASYWNVRERARTPASYLRLY
jgi:hypothetical protein